MNAQVQASRNYNQQGLWNPKCDGLSNAEADSSRKSIRNLSLTVQLSSIPDPDTRPRSDVVQSCNSIGNEMTHFKPIRLAPISNKCPTAEVLLKVPGLRNTADTGTTISRPAKSKFKPEAPLTIRNSAFCLVPSSGRQSVATQPPAARPTPARPSLPMRKAIRSSRRQKAKRIAKAAGTVVPVINTNRDRIMQERNDFELAKMLQDYNADAACAPKPAAVRVNGRRATTVTATITAAEADAKSIIAASLNTRRYFLRNRSKPSANGVAATTENPPNGLKVPLKASSRLKKMQN